VNRKELRAKSVPVRGLLGPAWRVELTRNRRGWPGPLPKDALLQKARDYYDLVRLSKRGARRAARKYPEIAAAERLNSEPAVVDQLKVMTVGGLTRREISQRLGIDKKVIATWEGLFYDVRDIKPAWGWLSARVFQPEKVAGKYDLAVRLKLAAAGGKFAVRPMLSSDAERLLDEGARLCDQWIGLHLKMAQALEIPFAKERSRMRFIKTVVDLQTRQARLNLRSRMFEQKCLESNQKHELQKLRLEQSQKREELRAEQAARRQEERAAREAAKAQEHERRVQAERHARIRRHAAMLERASGCPLSKLTWETRRGTSAYGTGTRRSLTAAPALRGTFHFAKTAGSSGQPITPSRTRKQRTA
jgi:hypothetical protein